MNARKLAAALASSAFFIALPLAHAQSVDVGIGGIGVSVGTENGLSVDVTTGGEDDGVSADVSTGAAESGRSTVDADVTVGGTETGSAAAAISARIGGSGSDDSAADVDVNLGTAGTGLTDDIDAGATASIGGTNGSAAGLNIGVGDEISARIGIGLGTGTADVPAAGSGGTGGTGGGAFNPFGVVAGMSESQLQSYKRTCADVTSQRVGFDKNLIALCEMIRSASR